MRTEGAAMTGGRMTAVVRMEGGEGGEGGVEHSGERVNEVGNGGSKTGRAD